MQSRSKRSENEEDSSIFDIDLLQDIPIELEVQPE